ncbi:permease prefix domain 1-containing protein [Egicoccus sp. AB-alg2]|uniref:permease prefix domain 1-containing protein n=1 Tax=Egicoccus sp. AB-alg2 TaxID=3242693 RepID=UPI00359EFBE3
MTVSAVEAQIAEWRGFVARDSVLAADEVEELEAHLREQIAELEAAGLAADEAFLVAVKRMGSIDAVSREFAREHSGRLWKQLVLAGGAPATRTSNGMVAALAFAVAAAVSVLLARLATGFPEEESTWLVRNAGLLVLPFLAGFFAYRRRLPARRWLVAAVPFVLAAGVVNLYPFDAGGSTELLVAAHLPVVLWFALAHPYTGGDLRSHERRMDFVRFTGEWFIYYVLLALGGGVLMGLTSLILEPMGADVAERIIEWVVPSGAAGAVVVAAWLVESKQRVVENMAPVLTMVFTPLFAVMLAGAAIVYVATGIMGDFDRELLGAFDALLVVVLGLVLYGLSAREPAAPPGWMDRIQLVAVACALVLDGMVLASMLARIGELGFTPNRAAALGLNLVLLVNLAGAAWLSARFLTAGAGVNRLERWQTGYLPVFAVWAAAVVVVLPPLFAFA